MKGFLFFLLVFPVFCYGSVFDLADGECQTQSGGQVCYHQVSGWQADYWVFTSDSASSNHYPDLVVTSPGGPGAPLSPELINTTFNYEEWRFSRLILVNAPLMGRDAEPIQYFSNGVPEQSYSSYVAAGLFAEVIIDLQLKDFYLYGVSYGGVFSAIVGAYGRVAPLGIIYSSSIPLGGYPQSATSSPSVDQLIDVCSTAGQLDRSTNELLALATDFSTISEVTLREIAYEGDRAQLWNNLVLGSRTCSVLWTNLEQIIHSYHSGTSAFSSWLKAFEAEVGGRFSMSALGSFIVGRDNSFPMAELRDDWIKSDFHLERARPWSPELQTNLYELPAVHYRCEVDTVVTSRLQSKLLGQHRLITEIVSPGLCHGRFLEEVLRNFDQRVFLK